MSVIKTSAALFASTSLLTLAGLVGAAQAQTAPAAKPQVNALEEVVVTASRTTSTVNKVAMSVSAVTQKTMEAQGIKNVDDLSRTVPGMTFRTNSAERNPSITIRGIGGYSALIGSATTGIYLDDTSLTQRNLNGARTGNGSPFPQLFDLDRVEVLRGPQGTLYGGSSEGGTVRFITPTPSLTTMSGQARVTTSTTYNGAPSYEAGFAVGGPLVQDKLGFRASIIDTHDGGYLDALSVFDGHKFASDVNFGDKQAFRGSLKWAITDSLTITPQIYVSRDYSNASDTFWTPTPERHYAGSTIYNGAPNPQLGAAFATGACTGTTAVTPAAGPCKNTVGGVTYYYAFPNTVVAPWVQAATPWYTGYSTGSGYYGDPAHPVFQASPRTTDLFLPSLVIDKDFGFMSVKSITSYADNTTKGYQAQQMPGLIRYISRFMMGATECVPTQNQPRGPDGKPLVGGQCYANPLYVPGTLDYQDYFNFVQGRKETTEELRFSSAPGGRLTWVAGGYYTNSDLHVHGVEISNDNIYTTRIRGFNNAWSAGAYGLPINAQNNGADPKGLLSPPSAFADISDRENFVKEREYAVFGEANFNITSKLKLTLGVRLSDYQQTYSQIYGGYQAGAPPAATNPNIPNGFVPVASELQAASRDPTKPNSATNPIVNNSAMAPFATDLAGCPTSARCPLQYTNLTDHEKTASPKLGLSYNFNDTDLVYFTYAKGFRPGGVNPPLPPITCALALAQLGLTSSPPIYNQDSVNSYELGNKMRLLGGRLQVNSAIFMIDWVNMQTTLSALPAPCGFQLIINAGRATSKGAELQANGRFGDFTLGANIGYDRAEYSQDVKNTAGVVYFNKGDNLGSPDWTVSLNGQYDFRVYDQPGYVRMDYTYAGKYQRGPGVGTSTYNEYTAFAQPTHLVNARVGMTYKKVDWSLFVQNLTNNHDNTSGGGGTTATGDPAQVTGNSFRPRTIGLQANYRF